MRADKHDENSLIRKIRRGLPAGPALLRLGIGDDAALWQSRSGSDLILTCDWFLEAVHFRRDIHPPDSIGWKCLARAVSDIAAMGGTPRCFLLSLAVPQSHTGTWLDSFLSGLRRASQTFSCAPAGGDTTRSSKILISVTVIGEVKSRKALLRSEARPGDLICVSGRLGEAQLGLELLLLHKSAARIGNKALEKHLYPTPRLELARQLASRKLATSLMDLSDGLSLDLRRLCEASSVGAAIEEKKLPLPDAAGKKASRAKRLKAALHGGDDYELLFTVSKRKLRYLPPALAGVPLTVIGEIRAGSQIVLLKSDGRRVPLESAGWDPFRRSGKTP